MKLMCGRSTVDNYFKSSWHRGNNYIHIRRRDHLRTKKDVKGLREVLKGVPFEKGGKPLGTDV